MMIPEIRLVLPRQTKYRLIFRQSRVRVEKINGRVLLASLSYDTSNILKYAAHIVITSLPGGHTSNRMDQVGGAEGRVFFQS